MTDPEAVVATLARCAPFQDSRTEDIRSLLPRLRRRDLPARGYLWHQGDPATELCFLLSGYVHAVAVTADGAQIVTQILSVGHSFGEPGLFLPDALRLTSVIAPVPSTVLGLPRDDLLRFLETHPPAMLRMLEAMSLMIIQQANLYAQVAFNDMRGRVAYQILKLGDEYGRADGNSTVIPFKISQTVIAGLVAGTRESVNRALADLADIGAIRQEHGYLSITDRESLRGVLHGSKGIDG